MHRDCNMGAAFKFLIKSKQNWFGFIIIDVP